MAMPGRIQRSDIIAGIGIIYLPKNDLQMQQTA